MTVAETTAEAGRLAGSNAAANLRLLKRLTGKTGRQIAEGVGLSRPAVHARLNGGTPISVDELGRFADYFGIPLTILHEPPDKALKLLADLGFQPLCWMDDFPGQYGRAAGF